MVAESQFGKTGDARELGGGSAAADRGARAVALGILVSRAAGYLRTSYLAALFGVGPHADVWQTALRAPNLIQNLLGEQTLSAAFIPTYVRLRAEGRTEDARAFAGSILGLLLLVAGGLALAGVLLARPFVALFAAGYLGDASKVQEGLLRVDRFELAVEAVRWIFPMTAFLVLAAWALGILNSHRRFLLAYLSPVAWNAAIVAGAVWAWRSWSGGSSSLEALHRLLEAACIGALAGGVLQFAVQLPAVVRLLGGVSIGLDFRSGPVREAVRAFVPALAGRGIVQLSSYLDQLLATLLTAGAVSALGYAQALYLLPLALFGSSVAAATLPELAASGARSEPEALQAETARALERSLTWQIPSTVALVVLGFPLVEGLFRFFPGAFGLAESVLVAGVLAAYALGLPASTSSRVVQSTFYALGDTRSPAKIAGARVLLSTALAVPLMFLLDRVRLSDFGAQEGLEASPLRWGATGLALAASAGAWYEQRRLFALLDRHLGGGRRWVPRHLVRTLFASLGAAAPGWLGYLAVAWLGGPPAARAMASALLFVSAYLWQRRRWVARGS